MGEIFDLHTESEARAKAELADDLNKQLCSTLGLGTRARKVLAAAARGQTPVSLAAAVGAVNPAPTRQTPTESELPSLFAAHETLEEAPAQEWLAGALGPLNTLVSDGTGDGLQGYEDVPVAANICTAVELRRAAAMGDIRDQNKRHCAREPGRELLSRAGAEGERGARHRSHGRQGRGAPPP